MARGCRELGYRRLRLYLLVAVALLLVGAGPGRAASGGAALNHSANSAPAHSSRSNPLARRGMWIWYVSSSNGGSLSSIISSAHRHGVTTLMIKSGDGSGAWSQFNSQFVSALHAHGLRACAWQYVYGDDPVGEAQVGAAAVRAGADCLLIDAEGQYEGKYVHAQSYIKELRKLIGGRFPVGLAGLPYVDYHPSFPYSVFLGPGGAQYNVPQMYWTAIQTTVDDVFQHTYTYNRPYGRTIAPLGDISSSATPTNEILRFRQLSRSYGAPGVSWWDWQDASAQSWRAISRPVGSLQNFNASSSIARLGLGAQGDLVVWAQEHLYSAGQHIRIDGSFGPNTRRAVNRFQSAHGLPSIGSIGPLTWQALLQYPAVRVRWTASGARIASMSGGDQLTMPVPKSARLRDKRLEIPPRLSGAG